MSGRFILTGSAFVEAMNERETHAGLGYTAEHDDEAGPDHLVNEAVSTLTHFGEAPTDAHVRHELIVAMSLLAAAVDVIDRFQSRIQK